MAFSFDRFYGGGGRRERVQERQTDFPPRLHGSPLLRVRERQAQILKRSPRLAEVGARQVPRSCADENEPLIAVEQNPLEE